MSSPTKTFPFLIAAALTLCPAVLTFVMAPYFLRLADTFTYTAELSSIDDLYDPTKGEYSGGKYSQSEFSYFVKEVSDGNYVIQNDFKVQTSEGESIFAASRLYGIDPVTQEHVAGLGDRDRVGTLFAPMNLKPGEKFDYWHVNYDAVAHMKYVDEVSFLGLPVYHYESYYEGETVDQTSNLAYLEGVPEELGILVEPHLELWVEPVTGYLVKYQDESTAYYYDLETGEKLDPWNHFSNTFTAQSVDEHVQEAKALKLKAYFFSYYLPLFFLGLALFVYGFCLYHLKERKQGKPGIGWLIPTVVLVVPVALLVAWWLFLRSILTGQVETLFDNRIQDIEEALQKRIEIYANTLEGTTGLFAASDEVTRNDWQNYVDQLDLDTRYPGIIGVGFSLIVWPSEKESHLEQMQADGLTDYNIHPEGERELYSPVIYLEPHTELTAIFGFDLLSDEGTRKQALLQAQDTGGTALSGKLYLGQNTVDESKRGFIMAVPIYNKNMETTTVEERRAAIYGFAYCPFLADQFIQGVLGTGKLGLNFDIYDGPSIEEDSLLYSHHESELDYDELAFSKTETIYLLGRPWTLRMGGLEEFELSPEQNVFLYGALAVGSLVALFFIFLIFALLISRQHLIDYVRSKKRFSL